MLEMRTNFQMVKDLDIKLTPLHRGILTGTEVEMIKEELCLEKMDILQLRNLRDFTVLYFSAKRSDSDDVKQLMYNADKLSGITSVIDTQLIALGYLP